MKIALIYGKGLDGCGVQRGGVEMMKWAKKAGHVCDLYYVGERSFFRGKGHGDISDFFKIDRKDFKDVASKIDQNYDVVIVNSYPSVKHDNRTILSFYNDLMKGLNKPIVVGMMHEIYRGTIDRIPMLLLLLNECDIVMNFSEKTSFAVEFGNIFPSKKIHERIKRFKLWADVDSLSNIGRVDTSLQKKRLAYLGRWTTMKDPSRVLKLAPILRNLDSEFKTLIVGIEKSIGAKYDIIDDPQSEYFSSTKFTHELPELSDSTKTPVFGPYDHEVGIKIMGQSMFGASFYRLLNNKNNYGDRMEYTQIEMIALGTIPVFDVDFGRNNHLDSGATYDSIDKLAVWSDVSKLDETAERLVELSRDVNERKKYHSTGMDFVRQEFDSSKVLPSMFETILKIGKDENKHSTLEALEYIFSSGDKAKIAYNLIQREPIPLALTEFEKKVVNKFKNESSRARSPVEIISKEKLNDFFMIDYD